MTIKENSRGSHDKAVPETKVKKKMKIIENQKLRTRSDRNRQ
jgi:hypothetical protein